LAVSFSANETDGLDGLLAGISLSILFAHLIIAFLNQDYHLAAFISSLIGSLTAFLWFNVYPAKFFMGDTGSMSLGVTIAILSFLSGTTLLLPLMAPIFVLESGSVILQVISKKIRKKKIFLSTPIHHHFEAKGLPEPTIVFRFWVVNAIGSILATVIYLVIKFYGS
jgi:phospho-N-acetylmuramoyl-pentapeptide-transferase